MKPITDFAKIPLGVFPTPIQKLENISRHLGTNVYIKRDDLTGLGLGGNKVRKLEFLMAQAKAEGAELVFTTGGAQSNHAMLTAAAAFIAPHFIISTTEEAIMKKTIFIIFAVFTLIVLPVCAQDTPTAETQQGRITDESGNLLDVNNEEGINYLVLVNKVNPLPEDWEEKLQTVHMTNSLGDDVEVEKNAYEAYLRLRQDLAEEGVFVDLDSARRSVAEQQEIMDRFTAEYGADYASKIVAVPGYSEHHTGLYLNIDGQDVYENEDMIRYPEIWAKIHEKLADYGFILRYLEGKEHITGYAYEPWHIRYIDDPDAARYIMDNGITLEGYLGTASEFVPVIDYGTSEIYTPGELEEAAVQIKCKFASWTGQGCELHNLRYAGDEACTEENVAWLNSHGEGANFVQAAEFLTDYHSPLEGQNAWEPDHEYVNYQWWLGRTEEGGWEVVDWGY